MEKDSPPCSGTYVRVKLWVCFPPFHRDNRLYSSYRCLFSFLTHPYSLFPALFFPLYFLYSNKNGYVSLWLIIRDITSVKKCRRLVSFSSLRNTNQSNPFHRSAMFYSSLILYSSSRIHRYQPLR